MRLMRVMALVLLMAFGAAACGSGETVGEGFEEFEEGENGGTFEFNTPVPTVDPGATQAPQQSEVPAATPKPGLEVKITKDGFDPTSAVMFVNTTLRVTNTDTVPHSYTESNRIFDSGEIAPGESWTYTPSLVETYQINDTTRTWIIGQLEVVPS